MPDSQAASMSPNAWSSVRPWPKNSGAEPIPPKLPQPSAIRATASPGIPPPASAAPGSLPQPVPTATSDQGGAAAAPASDPGPLDPGQALLEDGLLGWVGGQVKGTAVRGA